MPCSGQSLKFISIGTSPLCRRNSPSEEACMGKCLHRYYLLSLLENLLSSTSTSRRRQESRKERSYWPVLMQVSFVFSEPSTYLKLILSSLGSSVASWETPTTEDLITTALLTHRKVPLPVELWCFGAEPPPTSLGWGLLGPPSDSVRHCWAPSLSLVVLIKWKLIHLFCHLKNLIASQTQPPQISTRATFDFLLERRLEVKAN